MQLYRIICLITLHSVRSARIICCGGSKSKYNNNLHTKKQTDKMQHVMLFRFSIPTRQSQTADFALALGATF